MTAVLGLDLSISSTGVADVHGDRDTITTPGVAGDQRLCAIRDRIRDELTGASPPRGRWPDLVVIEDVVVRSASASVLGMLHGVVRADLIDRAIPYLLVAPATLKVYATSRGNAPKPDLRVELLKRTGVDERDDNAVDATWLRLLGLDLLGAPELDLPKDHRRALSKLALPALTGGR